VSRFHTFTNQYPIIRAKREGDYEFDANFTELYEYDDKDYPAYDYSHFDNFNQEKESESQRVVGEPQRAARSSSFRCRLNLASSRSAEISIRAALFSPPFVSGSHSTASRIELKSSAFARGDDSISLSPGEAQVTSAFKALEPINAEGIGVIFY